LATFDDYALWHLGVDDAEEPGTKGHSKFPYGDFQKAHRCAPDGSLHGLRDPSAVEFHAARGSLRDAGSVRCLPPLER
jgi:hypothetical protein